MSTTNAETRSAKVREFMGKQQGKLPRVLPKDSGFTSASIRENIALDLDSAIKELNSLRYPSAIKNVVSLDLSFGDYVHERWGFSKDERNPHMPGESFFRAIGVNPSENSVYSLLDMSDFDSALRWLVPEIFQSVIRLGLRKPAIYNDLIAGSQNVSQTLVTMPSVNISDSVMSYLEEGETIPVGTVSFGQKKSKIYKLGVGIEVSDEVLNYVPMNTIGMFFEDVAVKMNLAMDTLAISKLINGDQDDSSDAVATIGVRDEATNLIKYIDFLRTWVRLSRLGRLPNSIIAGEDIAVDILELPEFKGFQGQTTKEKMSVRTPLPSSQNIYIHSAIAANKILMVDSSSALMKLDAQPLRLENDRIVKRQLSGTYATISTGFATMMRDSRLMIDQSLDYSANTFPTFMDPSSQENINFR
jgi:hypothetical protein